MTRDLGTTNDVGQIRAKQKSIKRRRNLLKNQYYKELADNINNVAQAREVEKEFALAKKYSAFQQGQPKAISNEKLKSHFQQHFKAYAREGEKCSNIDCKEKIIRIIISNRSSFYCLSCQK